MAARGRRMRITVLAFVGVAAIVAGIVTGFFPAAGRQGLYATGLLVDGGASTVPPGTFDTPGVPPPPSPTPLGEPSPVLAPGGDAKPPKADRLKAKIDGVETTKATIGAAVLDAESGKSLYASKAADELIPASTMKVLTSTTALSLLGPDHRFTTKVVAGAEGQVILIGGGDPYLAKKKQASYPTRASIEELAAATAKQLKSTKQTSITLGYDTSLFSGPAWNPQWPTGYGDQVTPISALWVDEGRLAGGSPGPRTGAPAADAAKAFAAALQDQGIKVKVGESVKAAKGAKALATVQSMPLELIVEQVLLHSDNDAAEILFRHSGLASGKKGSFADGSAAIKTQLTKLGAWQADEVAYDGSGLARSNKISAATLAKVLRLAVSEDHPELRAVATGLPVAGSDGSLRYRFGATGTGVGRGLVRAKTGTLREVNTVAGYVRSKDGSLLVFAFLINGTKEPFAATTWLDRATAALASCGCTT